MSVIVDTIIAVPNIMIMSRVTILIDLVAPIAVKKLKYSF